jgi:hypothetical protein
MEDNPKVWPNIFFILYFGQLRVFHYKTDQICTYFFCCIQPTSSLIKLSPIADQPEDR